jgi:hypothetical protein
MPLLGEIARSSVCHTKSGRICQSDAYRGEKDKAYFCKKYIQQLSTFLTFVGLNIHIHYIHILWKIASTAIR